MLESFDAGVKPALKLVLKLLREVDPELHDYIE